MLQKSLLWGNFTLLKGLAERGLHLPRRPSGEPRYISPGSQRRNEIQVDAFIDDGQLRMCLLFYFNQRRRIHKGEGNSHPPLPVSVKHEN